MEDSHMLTYDLVLIVGRIFAGHAPLPLDVERGCKPAWRYSREEGRIYDAGVTLAAATHVLAFEAMASAS
jgi:hypothetical protein